jgi:DNA-binding response OmpR family regulator
MKGDTSERHRVLIVDDDLKVLDLLVDLLDQEGYEVISARNSSKALELALSTEPDIVIGDVVLTVIDGI